MSRYSYTVYLPDKRLPLPYLFSVSEQTRAQELESQIRVHPNFQPCLGQDIIYLFKVRVLSGLHHVDPLTFL